MPYKKKKNKTSSGSSSRKTSEARSAPEADGENMIEVGESSPLVKCPHLKCGLNADAVNKKFENYYNFQCENCYKDSKTTESSEKQENGGEDLSDVFCCLACGHLGCGRGSTHQHAIKHYEQQRTGGPHSLVMNLRAHSLWCYECDDEIPVSGPSKAVAESIDRRMKSAAESAGQKLSATNALGDGNKTVAQAKVRSSPRIAAASADVKGLSNLGNTCFFNAVMQNIAQTHALQIFMNDNPSFLKGGLVSIPAPNSDEALSLLGPIQVMFDRDPESLTTSLRAFLADFRQSKSTLINPGSLFQQICKESPQFKGFQQKDSHELLRHLLDALRTEETRRLQTAVFRHFGLDPDKLQKGPKDLMKKIITAYDVSETTFVEQVFGGRLLQVIECLKCHHVLQRYEPFLDLSLPIVDAKDAKNATAANTRKNDDSDAVEIIEIGDNSISKPPRAVEPLSTDDTNSWRTDCTLGSCLGQLTAIELLSGKDKFGCANCAKISNASKTSNSQGDTKKNRKGSNPVVYMDAEKRYLIDSPPAVLTLHLKRFQQVGMGTRKIVKHVEFSTTLDISPYCCKNGRRISSAQGRVVYSLYGVVSHSGNLSGGHYVAYVKVRPKDDKNLSFLQTGFNATAKEDNKICFNNKNNSGNHHNNSSSGSSKSGMTDHSSENGFIAEIGFSENAQNQTMTTAPGGKWYHINDAQYIEVSESGVLSSEAYILFYERIF